MSEIPPGYCKCGCGQKTTVPTETDHSRGKIKGVPNKFIRFHHLRLLPNHAPLIDRFWKYVEKSQNGCWEWIGAKTNGYGVIMLGRKSEGREFAHRLSYIIHYGEIPNNEFICHKCDNPACVRPDHLFLGTQRDNMRDMVEKGRKYLAEGEKASWSKLTSQQVVEIRDRYSCGGISQSQLAREYKVSRGAIQLITSHKRWKHI